MGKIAKHNDGKRFDFRVTNDSGALSVVATDAAPAIVADDRNDDEKFVKASQAILVTMSGDKSFNARLVLGGALTEEENAEWLNKFSAKLKVGAEGILVCGGFDPRFLEEWKQQAAEEEAYIYHFKIPAGEYVMEIYDLHGHLITMEEEWPKRIGAWFRKEHPGKPFPAWLACELQQFPDSDPGHEKEWEDVAKAIKAKKLAVDMEPYGVVDYIFHLRKADPAIKLSPFPEGGWFDYAEGARVPPRCPKGVRYMGEDADVESFIAELEE